jgi:hypothetical protein
MCTAIPLAPSRWRSGRHAAKRRADDNRSRAPRSLTFGGTYAIGVSAGATAILGRRHSGKPAACRFNQARVRFCPGARSSQVACDGGGGPCEAWWRGRVQAQRMALAPSPASRVRNHVANAVARRELSRRAKEKQFHSPGRHVFIQSDVSCESVPVRQLGNRRRVHLHGR